MWYDFFNNLIYKKREGSVKYTLYVTCSSGGRVREKGEHASGNYTSDQEAISNLMRKAQDILSYYDKVQAKIVDENGRIVHENY